MTMKRFLPLLLTFFTLSAFGQNEPPTLSNVQVDIAANTLTLTYDMTGAGGGPITVAFRAAEKGSISLAYNTANATGDIGPGLSAGAGKQITWDFSAYPAADFRLQLVASDGQPVDIQALVDQVDSARLKADLSFIEGVRHRNGNPIHLQEARDFIQNHFVEHHLETHLQEFDYSGYAAANIIGRQIGTESEDSVFILDGHFDTVNGAPGADDNGSAVAGFMEALRILAPYGLKKSIKYIGFDLEEAGPGLVGSKRYVDEMLVPDETTAGVLNFEMIGYYTQAPNTQVMPAGFNLLFPNVYQALIADEFRGNFITDVSYNNSEPLANAFLGAAAQYVPGLKVVKIHTTTLLPDLLRSDHAWFWYSAIPALMITDGAEFRNPYYHSPQDKSEFLNFTFMRQVVQATVATLAVQAGIQHATTWWTDTNFFTPVAEVPPCEVSLSPNPSGDFIRISWSGCTNSELEYELLGLQGQTVTGKTVINPGTPEAVLKVGELPQGVYFLRVNSAEKQWVRKVAVSH